MGLEVGIWEKKENYETHLGRSGIPSRFSRHCIASKNICNVGL